MKLPILSVIFALVTSISHADALKTDFEALFLLYPDKTEFTNVGGRSSQVLTLPGDITVRRSLSVTDNAVLAFDRSGKGAVGCAMKMTLNLRAVTQTCANVGSLEARESMDQLIERLVSYYAKNNFPRRDKDVVRRAVDTRIATMSGKMNPQICATDHIKEVAKMIDGLTQTDALVQMDALLATPRLPAVNPCL